MESDINVSLPIRVSQSGVGVLPVSSQGRNWSMQGEEGACKAKAWSRHSSFGLAIIRYMVLNGKNILCHKTPLYFYFVSN